MAKTATTTRTMKNTATNPLDAYKATLAGWPVKFAGPKPGAEQFELAHKFARIGSKTAMALAMYFRADGATTGQVSVINQGAYLNAMRTGIAAGQIVPVTMPNDQHGHKVYKLALPKPKAAPKARKAKADKPAPKADKAPAPADKAEQPAS